MSRADHPDGAGALTFDPRSANEIDHHVGDRLRTRRMAVGLNQTQLGAKLGVTAQQLQKYENGLNRLSASRLHQVSRVLQVPVSFFFEGIPGEEPHNDQAHASRRALARAARRP